MKIVNIHKKTVHAEKREFGSHALTTCRDDRVCYDSNAAF